MGKKILLQRYIRSKGREERLMMSLVLELSGISLPPCFFPKYRAKVLLILFHSLHLGSDGDWSSCPQVFFV